MALLSRRCFLFAASAAAAASSSTARAASSLFPEPLYPATDLSYFDTPITAAPADIRIGYASTTWAGQDLAAIADIADAGYAGIQLQSSIVPEYESGPGALVDELARHRLTLVTLSCGSVSIDRAIEARQIAVQVRYAKFLRACGGLHLKCRDQRPEGSPTRTYYKRLGRLLTEIGRRTADIGVSLGYRHQMKAFGEPPEEIDQILDAADANYVKLGFDVADYQQSGADPVRAVTKYADRLLSLQIRDVGASGGSGGDLKSVFAALQDVKFRGWVIVDVAPDHARTPRQSAFTSKQYLETIGVPVTPANTD